MVPRRANPSADCSIEISSWQGEISKFQPNFAKVYQILPDVENLKLLLDCLLVSSLLMQKFGTMARGWTVQKVGAEAISHLPLVGL